MQTHDKNEKFPKRENSNLKFLGSFIIIILMPYHHHYCILIFYHYCVNSATLYMMDYYICSINPISTYFTMFVL